MVATSCTVEGRHQQRPGTKRSRRQPSRFEAGPAPPQRHLIAALKGAEVFRLPSDVPAEVAAKVFADAPQPLKFSATRPAGAPVASVATQATLVPTLSPGDSVGVVSEFSGIGALEHGLQAPQLEFSGHIML